MISHRSGAGGAPLCNKVKIGLLFLFCLSALLSACKKPAVNSATLSGPVCSTRPEAKSVETSRTDVRIYNKKAFAATPLDEKKKLEETNRGALDLTLKERDRLEQELRFRQMEKEQMERAKEAAEKMLTQNHDAFAPEEIRKDILSFSEELKVIEITIEQNEMALNNIANTEREIRRRLSHDL
jgi:hypothetical protein